MKNSNFTLLGAIGLLLAAIAFQASGQPSPVPTTAFTRNVLRGTNSADFMQRAGFTNVGYANADAMPAGTTNFYWTAGQSNTMAAAKADYTTNTTLWVRPLGNDTTAIRGRPDKPFQSLAAAALAAQTGDTVIIGAGTNWVSGIRPPPGITIAGESPAASVLAFGASGEVAIYGTNNLTLSGFTITTTNRSNLFGYPFQDAFGCTNVIIRGMRFLGESDNLYLADPNTTIGAANPGSYRIVDNYFESGWDSIVFGSADTNALAIVAGNTFVQTWNATMSGNRAIVLYGNGGRLVVQNNSFYMRNGPQLFAVHNNSTNGALLLGANSFDLASTNASATVNAVQARLGFIYADGGFDYTKLGISTFPAGRNVPIDFGGMAYRSLLITEPTNGAVTATASLLITNGIAYGDGSGLRNVPVTNGVRLNGVLYSTLEAANTASVDGDVLRVVGTVPFTNQIALKAVTVLADGATLLNHYTNASAGISVGIVPGRAKWFGGTISNMYPGIYQAGFGFDHRAGDTTSTNLYVERLTCIGDTDAFLFNHTNLTSGRVVSCRGQAKLYALTVGVSGGLSFDGGAFEIYELSTIASAAPRAGQVLAGNNNFYQTAFYSSVSNAGPVLAIDRQAAVNAGAGTNFLYGVRVGGFVTNTVAQSCFYVNGAGMGARVYNATIDPIPNASAFLGVALGNNTTANLEMHNSVVFPGLTNVQLSVGTFGSQTAKISGGNITSNRIAGVVTGGRLAYIGGDVGASVSYVPSGWFTNLAIAATNDAPSDTTADFWFNLTVGGTTYRVPLMVP
jgi:hypothetical protein